MNLESLKDKLADAAAEAERNAKAFRTAPDAKTLQAKEISAQLATNAREALEAAEASARDARRDETVAKLEAAKARATVNALQAACTTEVEEIGRIEETLRALVARIETKVSKQIDSMLEAQALAAELGVELDGQQFRMGDVTSVMALVNRTLLDKYDGKGASGLGRSHAATPSLANWIRF